MSSSAPATAPPPQKPIRFVQNSEGPYAKRRRINSACSTCRRRKTRCSGERPICGTCLQNKHECGGYGHDADPGGSSTPGGAEEQREISVKRPSHPIIKEEQQGQPSPVTPLRAREESYPTRPPLTKAMSSESTTTLATPRKSSHLSSSQTDERASSGAVNASPSPPNMMLTRPGQPVLSLSTRNRMPYFRYFGPTAIMPGFKQMVVKIRGKQHGTGTTPSDFGESPSNRPPSHGQLSPSHQSHEQPPTPLEIPVYDTSDVAPSPLITHLCQTFFAHLGCNFPFLQKERFMRDLEEKQVDAILVDAVCAVSARFSTHHMLTGAKEEPADGERASRRQRVPPSDYGSAFAQRAHSAITDTFACPSVAVVQAALLLAYNEFGSSRDSGLWMYLGIAIRMAQDLGMQTLEGLRYEGRDGPTPKSVKAMPSGSYESSRTKHSRQKTDQTPTDGDEQEQRAVERERIDTFWALFFLDRVISSGTGRPVTLRDRDIELSFPSLSERDPHTRWPVPFPALIRVIHLYGRVTDLLNRIREVAHVTPEVIKRLGAMENHLTEIYQGLSPKLHFNAVNFQHYAKAGQGTNFILLHVWFHTLIVLLHQPTLLKTFEGEIQQLLPNSRELSMSSAKTITDILTFSELIDTKASVGNPFTSQPIYIAACAFLKETSLYASSSNPVSRPGSRSGSRPSSPSGDRDGTNPTGSSTKNTQDPISSTNGKISEGQKPFDQKQVAKYTLLATAANQNYQKCYRALRSLETYWAGVKYILTVLDQKAKGVGDPLLYTREEMESALEVPRPEPSFTSPGWRRKLSWGTYLSAQNLGDVTALRRKGSSVGHASPMMDPAQAIGWSLTGTMNSPSTSLAVLYPTDNQTNFRPISSSSIGPDQGTSARHHPFHIPNLPPPPAPSFLPTNTAQAFTASPSLHNMPPPPSTNAALNSTNAPSGSTTNSFQSMVDPSLVSDADLLLNLHSPYSGASPTATGPSSSYFQTSAAAHQAAPSSSAQQQQRSLPPFSPLGLSSPTNPTTQPANGLANANLAMPFGDMMIESQDIDVSALGDDMMPWLEYLPHDMLGFYDPTAGAEVSPGFATGSAESGGAGGQTDGAARGTS